MLQSMKVIGGGIDVLEAIGRKTYDVLAEGEHGLKKTIVKTRENRPTLSQVSACCLAALHARGSIVLIVLFIYLLIYLFIYLFHLVLGYWHQRADERHGNHTPR